MSSAAPPPEGPPGGTPPDSPPPEPQPAPITGEQSAPEAALPSDPPPAPAETVSAPELPPAAPPPPPAVHYPGHFGSGQRPWALIAAIVAMLLLGAVGIALMPKPPTPIVAELVPTIGDLVPVHTQVSIGTETIRELRRLAKDDIIVTDAGGRARVRLDSGATVVIDGGSKLAVTETGLRLEAGRIFVNGTSVATTVDLGVGSVSVVGSALALERREKTKVYVASGEVTARSKGKEATVKTGETADLSNGLEVGPERGFDDWTGGLAAPWSASGPPRRALGEVWGRTEPGQIGSPLTIRTHDVRAVIHGEVAETKVKTTFFNAGAATVVGDFRMGVPSEAIVSAFAVTRDTNRIKGSVMLAARDKIAKQVDTTQPNTLEWAGEGWLRGTLPNIQPGKSVTVEVSYVEWLPVRVKGDSHVVQYRYPLVGASTAPIVGEMFIQVDATPSGASALAAGMGATADGGSVELRKSDFRASADFVVDVEIPKPLAAARAYVAEGEDDEDESTIVVRTEVPRLTGTKEEGVTLAVVIDTSASIDPALLDAGRAFVESLVAGLGERDRLLVLGADTVVRSIGPDAMGPVDAARKTATLEALAGMTRGGATDLGRALEAAADAIPEDAPSAMVVYVGDGFPSVGDQTAEAITARLARRKQGVPRIGAVLLGPTTNRRAFAALTRGSGPLVEVGDSEEAASASISLLEHALVPTVTGVSVELGPSVARIYPRQDSAAVQGSSLMIVGKLASDPPKSIRFSYREGTQKKSEERALTLVKGEHPEDVARRWAKARAEAMALAGRGREAVTDAALEVGLLTPWTAWVAWQNRPGNTREYTGTSLGSRVLELGQSADGFDVDVGDRGAPPLSLANDDDAVLDLTDVGLEQSLYLAVVRTIEDASGQLRACRDTRAALRPDLPPSVQIQLKLDGDAKVSDVKVNNAGDEMLARCVATVIENLPYPRVGSKMEVVVAHSVIWPPVPAIRGKKCSPTSTLAVPLRRGVWRERMDQRARSYGELYEEARSTCELGSWTAKRAFLELVLDVLGTSGSVSMQALPIAKQIELAGDLEAALFLRKEALRRANPMELRRVRWMLLQSERLPVAEFTARYEKAGDDKARLDVVKTFLKLAPHDTRLRGRLIALLASLGEKEALADEARRLRADPFVDATLIADTARLLRRAGLSDDAKKAYGEIAERATHDPWAHALLGDRLREEKLFEDATAVYRALEALVPYDAATQIRLALAHAGASRLDVALRVLARVARTGGRAGDPELALLADRLSHVLIREQLGSDSAKEAERKLLERSLNELPSLPSGSPFLVRSPPGRDPINVWIERGPEKARELVKPEALAGRVGLTALLLEPGGAGEVLVSLARPKALLPAETCPVTISTFVKGKLVSFVVELPPSGDRVEVGFDGSTFTGVKPAKPKAPVAAAR